MAKKLKASAVIVAVGVLVYLVSLGNISVAEVGSAGAEETSVDATISLEACVVRVGIEALEQSTGDSVFFALSSISAEQIMSRVEADEAQVVSGVKVLVAGGSVAEIATEQNAREKEKDHASEVGEHAERETAVSLRAEVVGINAGQVAVEFGFKQIVSENGASRTNEAEREEEFAEVFEVSSMIGLPAGRPLIAGAKKSDDEVMFLILYADF
ncbi:MAG: hypothetical protein JSW59_13905 [Phycisphaerales bacterium]|nr:MAG: hypothetical protein JSW59_13905 [Phycisphaerales bacterium]